MSTFVILHAYQITHHRYTIDLMWKWNNNYTDKCGKWKTRKKNWKKEKKNLLGVLFHDRVPHFLRIKSTHYWSHFLKAMYIEYGRARICEIIMKKVPGKIQVNVGGNAIEKPKYASLHFSRRACACSFAQNVIHQSSKLNNRALWIVWCVPPGFLDH